MLNSILKYSAGSISAVVLLFFISNTQLISQATCVSDTSFTDVVFLIDNSQSIDDLEFDAFEDVILRSIQKVQDKCRSSQIGVVHYGGSFGRETFIEYDLSTENVFDAVDRRFCLTRNAQGFCSSGGGDDLNHAVGEIIDDFQDGSLNRNPLNKLQLVIFTDAFGFDANCGFINCSVIRPFTNVDLLKTQFGAQVTVVGASSQAEASLLAIYASPGGTYDNTDLFQDCNGTVDGCQLPRKYIPIEFNSPVEATSDNVLNCVGCEISISQAINPELGANRTICGDLGESAILTANVPDASGALTYLWTNNLPNQATVMVRPTVTTKYGVTVTDEIGCTGVDSVTVFVESCAPDCSPDTSFTDVLFLVDNSQSIDDQEFQEFESLILTSIQKVQDKCERSQLGLIHYGGAFGAETSIEYALNSNNVFSNIERQFCTSRNSQGFCSSGGGDDLNSAIGDIIVGLENGQLNRNPINKLQLVIFTDAFGFDANCGFINCSVIRPFNNIDLLKSQYDAQVTVVGASSQAEASLLAIYASPGGSYDNTDLFTDCSQTFDGCALPRKYIPVEFNSELQSTSDSIVSCVQCEIEIMEQVNATIGADQTICSDIDGDDATLIAVLEGGVAPFTYQWNEQLPAQQTVTVLPAMTTEYVVTITDSNGCEDVGAVTVIVEDCIPDCVDPPVFESCPVLYITCPGQSIDPDVAGRPVVSAANDACPMPTLIFNDEITSLIGCNQILTRTWTATYPDLDGLEATCVQQIQIVDREAPILENIPEDIIINSDATCSAIVTWVEPTATDNCGLRSVTSSIPNGSSLEAGVTVVMYTAIDQCGNISMNMFSITVIAQCCTEAPVISCPAAYSGCPNTSIDPTVTGLPTATGGVDCPDIDFTFSDDRSTGSDGCTVTIMRTWTATYIGLNNDMLQDQCIQQIVLADDTNPAIIDIPADITIDSDQSCTAIVSWTAPTAEDNCEISSITSDIISGSRFDVGLTVVTYTAVDICGNSITASFNVTVIERCCTLPPTITCPPTFMDCPESNTDPAITGVATGEPGGPDCPSPTISFSDDVVIGTDNCTTTIRRTWTATYPGETDINLTASCIQEIILTDTEAPTFIAVPDDIIVESDASCTALVAWGAATIVDNCNSVTVSSDIRRGSLFDIGTTIVTFTAVDGCGNTATETLTVTVIEKCCTVPPILTCVETFMGCPGSNTDPGVTGVAKAEPGSIDCPDPTVSFEDAVTIGEDGCTTTVIRTWTALYPGATDINLISQCTQMIILSDDDDPIIDNLPDDIVIDSDDNCTAIISWPQITATDNCEIASISTDIESGSVFDIGVTTVSVIVMDRCGNITTGTFTVTVNKMCCTDAPIISCPSDYTGCPNSDLTTDITGMATAMPGGPECPTPMVKFEDTEVLQEGCRRVINRTWTAFYPGRANDSDVITTCVQTIILDDTDGPTITNLPFNVVQPSNDFCNATITWDEPNASDNCEISSLTSDVASGGVFDLGETVVTYTAVDFCGNETTASFTITITQACCLDLPILNCPDDYVGCPGDNISTEETGTASGFGGGNFCASPTIRFSDETVSVGPCDGQIEIIRTWRATDPNNPELVVSCVQLITLIDTIAPQLFGCPEDVLLDPDDPIYSWIEPVGIDECEVTVTSSVANGSTFPTGITTVVISAIDGCGNTSTCSFDVTVPPEVEITCPEDIEVECLDSLILAELPAPMISTECEECTSDNIEGFDFIGSREGVSYYISERKKSWWTAYKLAEEAGGMLVVINDEAENEFLKSITPVNAAFIGLSDRDEEGTFVWVDGTPLTYTNWFRNEPNNFGNNQDYVEFLSNGQWNDQSNKSLPFIIEVDCVTVTRELLSTEINGSTTVYTVQYNAVDRCGTDDECIFTVTSDNSPRMTCPEDIVVEVPYGWSKVSWDAPTYQSCCSECVPKQIKGYIYMGNVGDSYYYCSTGRASWKSAERRAEEIGGTLAVIESAEENQYISSRLIQRTAYLGLSDYESEGDFKWVDGTRPSYTSWGLGSPTGDGDFVEVDENGDWYDGTGVVKKEFVVEIKGCNNVVQTEGPASGSTFRTGTTVVSYLAEDGCGGQAACSFTVTITADADTEASASSRSIESDDNQEIAIRNIEIYPNPVSDRLFLTIEGGSELINDISVYRADGRKVGVYKVNDVRLEGIDVSSFATGIHLVNVSYTDGQVKSKSFVIQ